MKLKRIFNSEAALSEDARLNKHLEKIKKEITKKKENKLRRDLPDVTLAHDDPRNVEAPEILLLMNPLRLHLPLMKETFTI